MIDIPNPAAVPGILPDIARPQDDLPPEADPHFGNDDENEASRQEHEEEARELDERVLPGSK